MDKIISLSEINLNEPTTPQQTTLKGSQSIEFTYTSLDEVKSDSEEQPVDENQLKETFVEQQLDSIDQLNSSSNNLESASSCSTQDQSPPVPATTTITNGNDSNSEDSSSLKKLSFDSVIERVKTNRVTNKEVCNYVLNLLVSGEFDLEKNFVIQNVKSILYMIQVIKCATPSLKVFFV